jgi:hypothetical protein
MASDQIYNSVPVFSYVHYRTVGWPMVQDEVSHYTMPRRQVTSYGSLFDFWSINCMPMIDRISSSTKYNKKWGEEITRSISLASSIYMRHHH